MAEIDVLKAQIVRQDLNTPWGFVLQGGADQGTPLKIKSLVPGSPAARIGLKPGDEVTEIGELQTEGLAYQQVQDLIDKHGDTLILTVERRARGSVPANPVINATETEPVKDYQPYDMTGAQQHPQAATTPQVYQFQTVRARPFEDKRRPYYQVQEQQSPPPPLVLPQQPAPPQPQYVAPAPTQQYSPRGYDYQDYQRPARSEESHLTQSRTFKVLESLMSCEEPAAGVAGLPPQRTLSQERWKAEQDAKRGSPRVKVFMPQQYNSPLGMYSAQNVVETFQAQAETVMDAMERHSAEKYPISEVQRAVMEN